MGRFSILCEAEITSSNGGQGSTRGTADVPMKMPVVTMTENREGCVSSPL